MTLTKCPKCKGKGTHPSYAAKVGAACTFGLLAFMLWTERDNCTSCEGKGYIKS